MGPNYLHVLPKGPQRILNITIIYILWVVKFQVVFEVFEVNLPRGRGFMQKGISV